MNARMTATVVPWPRSTPRSAGPRPGPGGDCLLFTPSLRGTAAPPHYAPAVGLLPKYRDHWAFSAAAVGEPLVIVLRSTSKMTAVDQPNRSTPFMAVIGPISRQRSIGTTSPYPNVV